MNNDQYIISKAIDILSNEPCSPALSVIRARQVERFHQDIQAATPDFYRNNFYPGASIETSASLAAAIVLAHYAPNAPTVEDYNEAYDFNAFVDQCAEDSADSADHASTVGYCNQGF